jgi:hypothetical protein
MNHTLIVAISSASRWSFRSSSLGRFWNSLTALQVAAVVSAVVLAVGAVIEYWNHLSTLTLLAAKWIFRRLTPVDRCVLKKLFVHSIGPILVVLGIAGEFVFEGRTFVVEDKQEEQSRLTISALENKASSSEREAAQLRKDAEGLKKDAEDEHLARVKIEAAVAFRSLDDKQKRDIGMALASFSPRAGASIWFHGPSTETEMFADDIAEALRFGRITTTAPGGIMDMREGGKWNGGIKSVDTGVVIQSTRAPAAIEFAAALIEELTRRGFDAKRQTDPPFEDKPSPIIWVTVGPRPSGPQGKYKLEAEREATAKKAVVASSSR